MNSFIQKIKPYENYKNFFNFITEYDRGITLMNLVNNSIQRGGNKDQLNDILSTYKDYNIRVDEFDTSEVRVYVYTLDDKNYCLALLLDYEQKFATISDLRNWPECVPLQNENLVQLLINFSSEVAKQSGMTHLELNDMSYYTCKGINPFKNVCIKYDKTIILSIANTLTNGIPYYYKYGFVYKNKIAFDAVISNKEKLKIKTGNIPYLDIMRIAKDSLDYYDCSDNIIIEHLQYIATLYEKHYHNNIKCFFKELKYEHCFMFSMIYTGLYNLLNLDYIQPTTMIKDFNQLV